MKRPHGKSIWSTRRDMSGAFVQPLDEMIRIWIPDGLEEGGIRTGYSNLVTRSEARLIAKRLNQCLDATVRR